MDKRDKNRRIHIKKNRRFTYCILVITIFAVVFYAIKFNPKIENKESIKKIVKTEEVIDKDNIPKISHMSGKDQLESRKLKESKIVVIDPGHGGYDGGAVANSGELEKDIVLDIALQVGKILKDNNIRVEYTRIDDDITWPSSEQKNLEARAKVSNDIGADLFVSIHCNYLDDFSVKGVEAWCRTENTPSEFLAKEILNELDKVKYTNKRNVKYESDGYLAILNGVESPATLIELGFLSNKEDATVLISSEGKKKIAEGIANGIINYVKLQKSNNELNSSEE